MEVFGQVDQQNIMDFHTEGTNCFNRLLGLVEFHICITFISMRYTYTNDEAQLCNFVLPVFNFQLDVLNLRCVNSFWDHAIQEETGIAGQFLF
jgi:hypothetical protein